MVQVPTAINVAVVPLTVQTAGVDDVKLTGSPELAVAVKFTVAGVVVPSIWVGIVPKVIVCTVSGSAETAKLCPTSGAATNVALPA